MPSLTIELPTDAYQRLEETARQMGTSVERLVVELLAENRPPAQALAERDQVTATLAAAGMLTAPSLDLQRLAAAGALLAAEDVRQALSRSGGKPLSEIVLEQ